MFQVKLSTDLGSFRPFNPSFTARSCRFSWNSIAREITKKGGRVSHLPPAPFDPRDISTPISALEEDKDLSSCTGDYLLRAFEGRIQN